MRRIAAASLALALFCGCAVGPNYQQPPVNAPDHFRDVPGPPEPAASLADLPWWEVFADPSLKALVDEAVGTNYDVRIAAWRVEQARARAGIARSEFFPQVATGGGWQRQQNSTFVAPGSHATFNSVSANINFGWELDLWGRIRRLNEAAKAEYLASEEARRGVLISLVAEVARNYFTLRELDEELVIAKNTVAAFQENVDLFERKLQEGAASALETSYSTAALSQVAAQVPELERRIEATENTLSLLLARNPSSIVRGPELAAQSLPPEIPAGVPSDLLQRRPDVREAEQQLVAANARIGVAVANFFPTISLTGLFGAVSPQVSNLFPAGQVWSFAAGLVAPVFQGGRLHSEYDVAYAQWAESKLFYEQTVTGAFAETTTVLYAREKLAASVAELEHTVGDYQEMVRLTNLRYSSGLSSYFEVIYAMQQLYPAEIALARVRLDLILDYVDIYRALGGGWTIPGPNWESPTSASTWVNPVEHP